MTPARVKAALAIVGTAALIAVGLWPRPPRAAETERHIRTAQVEAMDLYITSRVVGVLDAVHSHPIVSMTTRSKIVSVLDDGAWVDAGDVILKLDAAESEKRVSELEAEVADAKEGVRQAEADGQKKVQNARSGLQKAQETLELAKTQNQAALEKARADLAFREKELEVAQGQLEKRKRLAEERLIPLTELEAAQDEVEQNEFAQDRARRALARAEEDAAVVQHLRELDLAQAKLELDQGEASLSQSVAQAKRNLEAKQVELEEAQDQLQATELKTPAAGLLLLDRNWRGDTLRVGDEVYEGRRIGRVVDPAEMWVRCDISEAEIEKMSVGQEATVLVPAIGNAVLHGVVRAIDNLARERRWWEGGVAGKKVFAALIELTDRDERLRPGMSATVEIRFDHVEEALAVPVEALFEVNGQQILYRAEADGYRPVPVKVGERGELLAAVEGEIGAGDEVACQRPPSSLVIGEEGSK